ncbi:RHOMBOID-like protein 12, mitochondrial [Zingiber officinale]|uniref:Peptidase S54 rhomboid domain-containing protein n=1 Tax=Zingiber officinale TaxID=94328 RepID=A0A8J5GZX9_ZINOF|nr:RHOMBOID-like protein 12, mitochondrial [Zingiber officinale]KAG6512424.1 hypothetical protein ZIOFF_030535 [Zingiber officinale]
MRRNHFGKFLALCFSKRCNSSPIASSPFHGCSIPHSYRASPFPRSPRPDADPPIASAFAPGGLRLFSQPPKAVPFCASTLVGLKGLVVEGACALKISFQRRSGFDPKRLLSLPQQFLWKRFMPVGHGDEVVYGLLGANVAVFLLWRIVDPSFMGKHFMISLDNFKSGRLHTLITSAFSHSDFHHLLTNMIGLYFFGPSIVSLFGPEFLLKLYLGGALGGSVFYLAHKAFMVPSSKGYRGWDESRIPGLGASAAVNAIILLHVFLFPKNIYYVNLIIPVPAALLGAFLIGSDLWRIKKGEEHISGAAHLGGAVVAALVFARIKRWI